MDARWRIELLGGLRAESAGRVITRFATQKTGSLLAYLAHFLDRPHSREALIDLLWPESTPQAARQSLSQSLHLLRRLLEAPGAECGGAPPPGDRPPSPAAARPKALLPRLPVVPGALILADRWTVRLNPTVVTTDVAQFEQALAAAAGARSDPERLHWLAEAVEGYHGPLLVGYVDLWVLGEQERLSELYFQALGQLTVLLEAIGERERALEYARRGVSLDSLREEGHREVMRLLASRGEPGAALRQYRQLERLLAQELGTTPSPETRALARKLACGAEGLGEPRSLRDEPMPRPGLRPGCGVRSAESGIAGPSDRTPHPAPRTGAQRPFLPQPLTRFFGRTAECARLEELLRAGNTRLVTLIGPAGSGKTRLAQEVAARLRDPRRCSHDRPPRAPLWFVPLADLAECPGTPPACRVAEAVRDALDLPRLPEIEPLEQVIAALARQITGSGGPMLLLDNVEHLIAEGATVVRAMLERVPTLTCLVTSRRRLGLSGEREFPVLPLPVPTQTISVEQLGLCPSVQLFMDRAQAVRPDFALREENAAAVADVCRRLEGLPLALELAAARAAVLSPAQMLEHLDRRFDFLVGQHRDTPARHRTLRAAIEGSFRLLSPELQQFFTRLAVFRGGWTLAAAEWVAALPTADGRPPTAPIGGPEGSSDSRVPNSAAGAPSATASGPAVGGRPSAVDPLERLRECSLVMVEHTAGEVRFRMLEALHEYAREQWEPEDRATTERRHAQCFLTLAEQAASHLEGPDQEVWLERLEREHGNLRAALDWAAAHGEAVLGLRLGGALWDFWQVRGYPTEGRKRLADLLALPGASERTAFRAKALLGAGALASDQGDYGAARELLQESLSIWRELRDEAATADTLHFLADVVYYQSQYGEARALYEESLALRRGLRHERGIARSLESLGTLTRRLHDSERMRALYEESLALRRRLGNKLELAASLGNMGNAARDRGDYAAARAYYEESLALRREVRDRDAVGDALQNLGAVAFDEGDLTTARAYLEESLALRRELGNKRCLAIGLNVLGDVVCRDGDHEAARALLGESLAIRRALGDRVGIASSLQSQAYLEYRRGSCRTARALYAACLALCRELSDQEGIARCLEGLAQVAVAAEESDRAARFFGAAEALREATALPLRPIDRVDYDHSLAVLRTQHGAESLARAWVVGRTMRLEQLLTDAAPEALGEAAPCDAEEEA
jgi:predicted ATPase/DNA-binding SARP family transcriptional activator